MCPHISWKHVVKERGFSTFRNLHMVTSLSIDHNVENTLSRLRFSFIFKHLRDSRNKINKIKCEPIQDLYLDLH